MGNFDRHMIIDNITCTDNLYSMNFIMIKTDQEINFVTRFYLYLILLGVT